MYSDVDTANMSFINFRMDHFIDKVLSLPLKMKADSFTQSNFLCPISNSPNFYLQHTEEELLNNFFQSGVCSDHIDYPLIQLMKAHSFIRNLNCNFLGSNKFVSPHVSSFVQSTISFLNSRSDMLFSPNISNILSEFSLDSALMKHCYSNPKMDSVDKQLDITSLHEPEITMSVTVEDISQKVKSDMAINKCNVPNGVTLNLKLTSQKTKELQKRSKKRRRRQKKVRTDVKNSNLGDEVDSCKKNSPNSSPVCFSTRTNEEPGFVVKVKRQEQVVPNIVSSFLISVENVSDDSDWDSCTESDILTETDDFELTGLVLTNLNTHRVCSTPYSFSVEMNVTAFCQDDENEEMSKFQAALLEVNKKWNESTKGVMDVPKSSSKVSFAPDNQLVEVFPVEICERKGEWEIYSTERLRFKRRVDELEKVISPCLAAEHRLEVYKKFIEPVL